MTRGGYYRRPSDDDLPNVYRPTAEEIARECERLRQLNPRPPVGCGDQSWELPEIVGKVKRLTRKDE